MIRKKTYTIQEVLDKVISFSMNNKRILFDGYKIRMHSDRLRLFKKKGIKCVRCGLEGSFFALERFEGSRLEMYHLNLYAVDENGKEVLMTKDHIKPKSKGGKNSLKNLQVMCTHCNCKKGDKDVKM